MSKSILVELLPNTTLFAGPSPDSQYFHHTACKRFTLPPLADQPLMGGTLALDTVDKPVERAYLHIRAGREVALADAFKAYEKAIAKENSVVAMNVRAAIVGGVESSAPVLVVGPDELSTY